MFRGQRRIDTRGTPDFAAAVAQGQLEPLPRIPPATLPAVQRAESLLGAALPDLLSRLYLEVSNGGYGPAYGIPLALPRRSDAAAWRNAVCEGARYLSGTASR